MTEKKKLTYLLSLLAPFCLVAAVSACGCSPANCYDGVYQYSTIQALANGFFEGSRECKSLISDADIGLGTFEDLDGEMIVLNGQVYQAKNDGTVASGMDLKSPFAIIYRWPQTDSIKPWAKMDKFENVSGFAAQLDRQLEHSPQFKRLLTLQYFCSTKQIDFCYSVDSKNTQNTLGYFNVLRMDGTFDYLKLRSVPKQSKPYPTLAEVVKKQAVFEHRNIKGTLIGFRCPDSIGGLNIPGWHFHFISEDRKVGGHVLDLAGHDMAATIIPATSYMLHLPDTDGFRRAATQPVEAGGVQKAEK